MANNGLKISLFNVMIKIQKSEIFTDEIGNHSNVWKDFYSCHATVSGENGREINISGTVVDKQDIAFTVRYCKSASQVEKTKYRIIFENVIYNIIDIDHMNYTKKCLKFRCKREER